MVIYANVAQLVECPIISVAENLLGKQVTPVRFWDWAPKIKEGKPYAREDVSSRQRV